MREWVEFNKGANINAMNKKKKSRIQRKCTKPNNWKQTILNTIFCLVVTNFFFAINYFFRVCGEWGFFLSTQSKFSDLTECNEINFYSFDYQFSITKVHMVDDRYIVEFMHLHQYIFSALCKRSTKFHRTFYFFSFFPFLYFPFFFNFKLL